MHVRLRNLCAEILRQVILRDVPDPGDRCAVLERVGRGQESGEVLLSPRPDLVDGTGLARMIERRTNRVPASKRRPNPVEDPSGNRILHAGIADHENRFARKVLCARRRPTVLRPLDVRVRVSGRAQRLHNAFECRQVNHRGGHCYVRMKCHQCSRTSPPFRRQHRPKSLAPGWDSSRNAARRRRGNPRSPRLRSTGARGSLPSAAR